MITTERIAEMTSYIKNKEEREFMENFLMNVYSECPNVECYLGTLSKFALDGKISITTASIFLPMSNEIYYKL